MSIETDLTLQFPAPGGQRLDFEFHFKLPERGITAISGPSGAGKTTFLRCLAGLERAQGRVSVLGQIWQDEKIFLPTHCRPLGYVFQEASLFPHLTVRQNLAYGAKRRQKRAAGPQSAPAIDMQRFIETLGIAPLMERRPETLSGGERQRCALARALAAAPQILLLDEPLAALDQKRKEEILPHLEKLRDLNIPIIYVTHARDEIDRLADRVLTLNGPVKR